MMRSQCRPILIKVSIPPRYADNTIGKSITITIFLFQFLLGTLITRDLILVDIQVLGFNSLLGTLITELARLVCECVLSGSIHPRYADNVARQDTI